MSTYDKRWNVYSEYNQIPHTPLYELRHTFVTIAKKLKEGQLKSIIGHSEAIDTFGTYGHEVEGICRITKNISMTCSKTS